ncbi:MAG: STAS domain-containing protein [Planctomycetota bacterium]|nr:STAS domain-containing protein [Planctomycetota bacterium]
MLKRPDFPWVGGEVPKTAMWTIFTRKSNDPSYDELGALPAADVVVLDAPRPGPRKITNPIATIEHIGPTAVATVTVDQLSPSEGIAQLGELLNDLAEAGAKNFVLDMQNVQHMDSDCATSLVKSLNKLAGEGGRIAVVNPDHSIQSLFQTTQLDRSFPICHDVMAALAAVERNLQNV